jgi:hypothetical protein
VLREEPLRPERRACLTVVAFQPGLSGVSFQVVEQKPPEGVLVALEDSGYAASEVRKPSSAAIGRIAATTFRMWAPR